jgi:hypothetical protein
VDINKVQYKLIFPDGPERVLELHLRSDTLVPVAWLPPKPPEWAALEFQKCTNCPLKPNEHAYCPAALNLVKLVEDYNDLDLLDTVKLEVKTADRAVIVSATVQKALGSLIGLLMATSDCPHAAYFRPLARFHLPLATEAETIYRAVTAYAMAQFVRRQAGKEGAADLDGLSEIYANLETVNTGLSARLKAARQDGSIARSLMEWDVFSGMFPMRAEAVMESMRPLFSAYLSDK